MFFRYFLILIFISTAFSQMSLAQTMDQPHWFTTGEFGYANYSNMYHRDGQTPSWRFSIGHDLAKVGILNFALEAGIQSGNTMRFPFDPAYQDEFGNVVQVVSKPVLDLLLTVETTPLNNTVPLFAQFKVGPAYRSWVFSRSTIDDKTEVSFEAQVGLGYWITKRSNISLSYQTIFGSNPNFHVYADGETGYISKLPNQHAVFFGISTRF